MRKYENQKENRIQEVYCNGCGKKLLIAKGMVMGGGFHGQVQWGFFSQKDGETHSFDPCEKCYDPFVACFQIPLEKKIEWE